MGSGIAFKPSLDWPKFGSVALSACTSNSRWPRSAYGESHEVVRPRSTWTALFTACCDYQDQGTTNLQGAGVVLVGMFVLTNAGGFGFLWSRFGALRYLPRGF